MEKKNTAILVFAKTAIEELNGKQLFGNDRINQIRLFQQLNRKVYQTAKSTDLPFYVFNGSMQKGNSFQERYYNAIHTLFKAGYEKVVCIGNDSPEIRAKDVIETASSLEKNDLVLGETTRGGAYTIAFTRKGFYTFDFHQVDWNTKFVFNQIINLATELKLDYAVLESIYAEMNKERDVLAFIALLKKNPKKQALFGALFGLRILKREFLPHSENPLFEGYDRVSVPRGPPAMVA